MNGAHVSHDTTVEADCVLCSNVAIGGHSHIMRGAVLGLNSAIHQHSLIGAYSMLGMGAVVHRGGSIEPGKVYVGNPARLLKKNAVGIRRNKITPRDMAEIVDEYDRLRAAKNGGA